MDLQGFMEMAVEEARLSLREGNGGFGAVVVRHDRVIAKAHDRENTAQDPTAHAELTAIRQASEIGGKDLRGCMLVSTHEPCPMCSAAFLWANMGELAYGYSIEEALREGRRRINLPCRELFDRAGRSIPIHEGVGRESCRVLCNRQVREQIKLLRDAGETDLRELAQTLAQKRIAWIEEHRHRLPPPVRNPVQTAYQVLLSKLDLSPEDAPILEQGPDRIVFASRNFCPTLEACRILGLDTRSVCRLLTEEPTKAMLRQLDPHLRFSRNYDRLRPSHPYCEESIFLAGSL